MTYTDAEGIERWTETGEDTERWRNWRIRKLRAEVKEAGGDVAAEVTKYLIFHDGFDPRYDHPPRS